MRTIIIGRSRHYETQVSDEDYDYLTQWPWTFAVSHPKGGLVYARRSIRVGGDNITILMHRVVLERAGLVRPSPAHTADHDDGNSLNNQRGNLRWATGPEQAMNRRRFVAVPIAKSARFAEIPY
jgi:hypothetical protein